MTAPANRCIIIDQSFLCANQIVVCLKFLEKTVDKEAESAGCLITARQCFFERILWCLARLKSTVKSANDHVPTISEPENFVTLLDEVLAVLSMFTGLDDVSDVTNKAEQRAQLMMESREVRGSIEQLLSHGMAFANIALESDKNPIIALSQNVLKLAMEFEEEFSLVEAGKKLNVSSQRMKSIELENSLLSLESFTNSALLRLVYEVFYVMDKNVVDELVKVNEASDLEQEIEKFDLLIDRLIQIGHFAIWFSRDDPKISSIVRSCLASIESLDSYLVPAITGKSDPSFGVLQNHFEEETNLLKDHVQKIIDTTAFCTILMEELNSTIEKNRNNFDEESLTNLVRRSNVLLQHFQINAKNLKLSTEKVTKFYFHDFKLILTECDAILNFPDPIDDRERRVLKRFMILNSTIRKLQNAVKNAQKASFNDENQGNKVPVSDFPSKCSDYFNTIRPSALGSILYESKRSMKFTPKASTTSKQLGSFVASSSVRSSKKKRHSLRITIFKKHHELGTEEAWINDDRVNESMNLQITEILDQLTDLSTTLSQKLR